MSIDSLGLQADTNRLLVYRKVSGADEFLAQVSYWGAEIFGNTATGMIVRENDDGLQDYGFDTLQMVEVGLPRVRVVDPGQLVLHMFDRGSPKELNFVGKFQFAAKKMLDRAERVYKPVTRKDEHPSGRYRTGNLYATFDRIGVMHGVDDQTDVGIVCNSVISPVEYPGQDGEINLSLALHPAYESSRMLNAQARSCLAALAMHSKKLAYPAASSLVHIPFATMPAETSERDRLKFISKLDEHTQGLALRMAGVQVISV